MIPTTGQPAALWAPAQNAVQLLKFCIVGGSTVALDYALLFVLVTHVHTPYFIAGAMSFLVASACNYLLSSKYVFTGGRFGRTTEAGVFLVTSAIGLILNQLTLYVLIGILRMDYLTAKLVSVFVVLVWNFLSKKKLVFLR